MKRDKVSAFFKSKGFYVSLFTGIFAVFVLTMVYANVSSIKRQSEEDLSDYMETPKDLAEVNPVGESAIDAKPDASAEQQLASNKSDAVQKEKTDDGKKSDDLAKEAPKDLEVAQGAELESEYGDVAQEEQAPSNLEPVTAVNESQNALQNLHFQEDGGLLWPAEGNIIKNYSMEKLVYFETLNQFKCNPAILIGLEAGSDVLCGAKGVVTAVTESDELGNSVLVDIGNGYQLKYAQLENLAVEAGDMVEEGQVLAQVAEPTIYYSTEGPNLYFQVLQNGETVNPLLLLR